MGLQPGTATRRALRGVDFSYNGGPKVLDGFSLDVKQNGILCIVGANGSGKSTIGRLLAGDLIPDHGDRVAEHLGDTAIRYQNFRKNLLPWYSGQRNLELSCYLSGARDGSGSEELGEWLELISYERWCNKKVAGLSGGQQQALSVVMVIGLQPQTLVLDEPFSAVDPTRVTQYWRALRKWPAAEFRQCIVITHNLDEAIALADVILVLRPSAKGAPEALVVNRSLLDQHDPQSRYFSEFRGRLAGMLYDFAAD